MKRRHFLSSISAVFYAALFLAGMGLGHRVFAEQEKEENKVVFYEGAISEDNGNYHYAYPLTSVIEEYNRQKHQNQVPLRMGLDPNAYSGAAVGVAPSVSLTSVLESGYLSFLDQR